VKPINILSSNTRPSLSSPLTRSPTPSRQETTYGIFNASLETGVTPDTPVTLVTLETVSHLDSNVYDTPETVETLATVSHLD
jgi:hypothetical protein